MTTRKLYMANELPYNKYRDTKIDIKLLTWSLDEAKVVAKKCTAQYYDRENSNAHEDDEEYSDNFILGGGIGIMTVSAEAVLNTHDIKSCSLAVLKKFVTANSPPGTAIPTSKKLLLPLILNQLVVGEYDRIIYAEDVAKEKAAAEAYAKSKAEAASAASAASTASAASAPAVAAGTISTPELEGSAAKKRKLDE